MTNQGSCSRRKQYDLYHVLISILYSLFKSSRNVNIINQTNSPNKTKSYPSIPIQYPFKYQHILVQNLHNTSNIIPFNPSTPTKKRHNRHELSHESPSYTLFCTHETAGILQHVFAGILQPVFPGISTANA